jgi:neuronal guanine nucleotide exchange factor
VYEAGIEANYSPEALQKTLTNATNTNKQRPMSAPERKNSGNTRPNSPPPLPPNSSGSSDNVKKPRRKEKRSSSNTSWYAECGLFDQTAEVQNTVIVDTPKRNVKKQDQPVSNSWYAEVGLWEMSTSSPNDSSVSEQDARSQRADLSGGDSPLTAGSPENSGVIERRFADEPLYQFYTAAVVERDMRSEMDSDGYEEIGDGSRKLKSSRPSAMELIQPREGQHRTLWCEIPEVVSSGILSTIGPHQKKLQEAKFEIITSEASYINSLNVLEKHFMSSLEMCDESVLSKNDRRTLFSNLIPVKTCSEHFLAELEECWQDNILLNGISEVVYKHASNNFSSYVKYCSNQICLDRTLRGLKEQNMKFSDVLLQLESNPICQLLSLHSFLMLPMQRITRLPLLIDAVLTRLSQTDDEYTTCQLALATLNKIVQNCNEDARKMERMEEILILSRQLYFPSEIKAVPIISSVRWLVRKGELTHLVWRGDEGKLTFGKKFSRIQIHMFLFTDLLVITKKKRKSTPDATGDECYAVIDYCPRNLVQMTSTEGMTNLPVKFTSDGGRNLVLLTMLQNHEKKTVEMVLSCSTESDRQRWLEAVSPPVSDNPDETVYEEWDCPQVMAIHPYVACQPDELSLEVSDVVNVLRKMSDGWYQGERIRDGERGWFPGNYTSEVASAHVRARNLKQRYRLLALSGNFLEAQRKEKQAK